MLLTTLPYLAAARPGFAGPGLHFSGFIWGVDDANVYLSQIRQYAEGHLFAYDQFTTLPQTPRYLNLLWLTLGQARRASGLPPVLATSISDEGWPADQVDQIAQKFQASAPPPRLPAEASSSTGAATGGTP